MAQITKDTIIGDILDIAPETAPIFLSIGNHVTAGPTPNSHPADRAVSVYIAYPIGAQNLFHKCGKGRGIDRRPFYHANPSDTIGAPRGVYTSRLEQFQLL